MVFCEVGSSSDSRRKTISIDWFNKAYFLVLGRDREREVFFCWYQNLFERIDSFFSGLKLLSLLLWLHWNVRVYILLRSHSPWSNIRRYNHTLTMNKRKETHIRSITWIHKLGSTNETYVLFHEQTVYKNGYQMVKVLFDFGNLDFTFQCWDEIESLSKGLEIKSHFYSTNREENASLIRLKNGDKNWPIWIGLTRRPNTWPQIQGKTIIYCLPKTVIMC